MRRVKKKSIIFFIFILLLIGCKRNEEAEKGVLFGKNIVCYGDSITWGNRNDKFEQSHCNWPKVLGEITGANVVNEGVTGSLLAKISEDREDYGLNGEAFVHRIVNADISEYDIIMIAYGTNDADWGIPLGENDDQTEYTFKGAINKSIAIIREKKDIEIVLIVPIGSADMPSGYQDAIVEMGKINKVGVIDLRKMGIMPDDYADVFWDGSTHPTDSTYHAIGAYISYYPNMDDAKCYRIYYYAEDAYLWGKKTLAINNRKIGPILYTQRHGSRLEWYTDQKEGEKITEDTVYCFDKDITLYARFTEY